MSPQKSSVGLKQFRGEGCLSYLVWDRATRLAAIVDPQLRSIDDYRSFLAENGLKLSFILDTHTHADHYSVSHRLATEYGCPVGMSEKTQSQRPTRRFRDRDRIEIGSLTLEVLETPGHTPDSLSYYLSAAGTGTTGQPGLVFTGDTLLIGASGRTDFPGASPQEQWKSIREVLGSLPSHTVVLPGHDYSDLLFSTIGIESKKNPHWLMPSVDAFAAMKNAECLTTPSSEIQARVDYNLSASPAESGAQANQGAVTACGVAIANVDRGAAINVEKYRHKLDEQDATTAYIDVREIDEYEEGHMKGAHNIPLWDLWSHLDELRLAKRGYFSCLSGRRSLMAVKTLSYLGFPDVVNVTGGIKAWHQAGLPVAKD